MTDIGYYRLLSIFGLSINSEAYNLEANRGLFCMSMHDRWTSDVDPGFNIHELL